MFISSRLVGVAVDCIALNYWGKHKRKMAIRGINWQEPPSTSSLYYYEVALSLYSVKWTTIIRLWWLSQWLVTHGHHPAVIIYLHVAPSPGRHITSLSIGLKFYTYHSHFNSHFTSSTHTLWFKTIFNGGCYWEGLMAFLPGPSWGAICCSWLHRLELLRKAQEKDGNSGH